MVRTRRVTGGIAATIFAVSIFASTGGTTMAEVPNSETAFCKSHKDKNTSVEDLVKYVTGPQTAFSFDLYAKIAKEANSAENIVVSPASVHVLLAMLDAGAKDKTAAEIGQAMHLIKGKRKETYETYGTLIARHTCPDTYSDFRFHMANGLFRQTGKATDAAYNQILRDHFDARMIDVDFAKATETARSTINEWVKTATQSKIQDLIAKNTLTNDTKMVLVNAVYVKDSWENPFAKEKTKDKVFFTQDGKNPKVPMMYRPGSMTDFRYADMNAYHAVSIPTSGALEVLVLLPKDKKDFATIETSLSAKGFDDLDKKLGTRKVNLTLPKFKLASSHALVDRLKELGIKDAFVALEANFDGIDGGKDQLFVSEVVQKATIEIDELGLEAAAATAADMRAGGMPPKPTDPVDFVADHPFIYVLKHRYGSSILFMGRVMNPAEE